MANPPHARQALSSDDARLLIESVQDYAICTLDAAGDIASWYAGAERIHGYKPHEIIGKHFSVFYREQDILAGMPQRELALARERGRAEDEGWRVRKDGSSFPANVLVTALRDAHGNLRGFAKITRDLSVKHAAEDELRRSEERLRLLIEAVGDYAIYMLDPEGKVSTWNSGAQKIKGYRADEIIGQHYSRFFTPEDVRARKPVRELETARTQGRFEEEGWRVRKDGSRFWANVVLTRVLDSHERPIGFAKVTRDLSERIEAERTARELVREQAARAAAEAAEAQLRESEQRYRALSRRLEVILEAVADGITVQDRLDRVIFANSAAAAVGGFGSVAELLGTSTSKFLARYTLLDEQGAPLDEELLPARCVLRGDPNCSMVVQLRELGTGRTRWFALRAGAVADAEGAPELAVNVWHDVSEDRRREQHERYLAQASAALSKSLDYLASLNTLANQLAPGLADCCAIHLLAGELLVPVAVAPEDLEQDAPLRELLSPSPAPDADGIWSVLRSGSSVLHEETGEEFLQRNARDSAQLHALRALGVTSLIIVPIRVATRVLGTLALVSTERARRYDQQDLALAQELALRAGNAVENARLYAAERDARDQLALLARAGEAFSGAASLEPLLRGAAELTVPTLGDFALFEVAESNELRRVASVHGDPALARLLEGANWQRAPRADGDPWGALSGLPVFQPHIDDEWLERAVGSAEQLALLRRLELGSLLSVPLRAGGELLGSLTLGFGKSRRTHTPDDLKLAEELARRAGMAVVQVRLYERAQDEAHNAEQARRRAEEANRVKDEFLATVSHELRTPLNAILGWSALLSARSLEPAVSKAVHVIHRNAQAQGKIIEDILDVSRIITGKLFLDLKGTNLVEVVQHAIEVVRPSAVAKRLSIDFTPPVHDCSLVADPERLQQVVWNLLSNAVKFTESGGQVRVTLEHEGSNLRLQVSDSGKGIEPDFLPFVFDRFKQADSSTTRHVGGLGLGLAIVRHLVELHGGRVEATSEGDRKGATFTVVLPVVAPVLAQAANDARCAASEDGAPQQPGALAGTRVLVVDDEPDARELVKTVLTQAGAAVETAGSASEGFTLLQRFQPHVLVSDIGMPREDGYSFIQRVRALDAAAGGSVPSLALTAYTRSQDRSHALALGFSSHLGKPVDPGDLVSAVADLAGQTRG
jgi:PAS domain S-box-containing protein